MRPQIWSLTVKCANKDCDEYDAPRVIEVPHLGDGVFLSPTEDGPFGIPMLNLTCGSCAGANSYMLLVESDDEIITR